MTEPGKPARTSPRHPHLTPICPQQVGKLFPKSGTVISEPLQKRLCILHVRKRNHRRNAVVLIGFGLFYLLDAGFQFCQRLAGQDAGTEVGNKRVPYMRHGVVPGKEVIKPAPVLICNEVRCERIQQLEIMLHRNCILPILQRR